MPAKPLPEVRRKRPPETMHVSRGAQRYCLLIEPGGKAKPLAGEHPSPGEELDDRQQDDGESVCFAARPFQVVDEFASPLFIL